MRCLSRRSMRFCVVSEKELGVSLLFFTLLGACVGAFIGYNFNQHPAELWCTWQKQENILPYDGGVDFLLRYGRALNRA